MSNLEKTHAYWVEDDFMARVELFTDPPTVVIKSGPTMLVQPTDGESLPFYIEPDEQIFTLTNCTKAGACNFIGHVAPLIGGSAVVWFDLLLELNLIGNGGVGGKPIRLYSLRNGEYLDFTVDGARDFLKDQRNGEYSILH